MMLIGDIAAGQIVDEWMTGRATAPQPYGAWRARWSQPWRQSGVRMRGGGRPLKGLLLSMHLIGFVIVAEFVIG